jgi:hypothetical protein
MSDLSQSLTERVMARIHETGLAVDRRDAASRPKLRRRRSDPNPQPAGITRTPEQVREARTLRRVFLDMGDSYRDYRRRTGEPVSADVRGAADRFRKELDVTSLVAVAATLDALDVLTW